MLKYALAVMWFSLAIYYGLSARRQYRHSIKLNTSICPQDPEECENAQRSTVGCKSCRLFQS
jgi:hypothetical protein